GDTSGASAFAWPATGVLLGSARDFPGQCERGGKRRRQDGVWLGPGTIGYRIDPGLDTSGEGARGAVEPNAAGPPGERDASSEHFIDGGGQRVFGIFHRLLEQTVRGPAAGRKAGASSLDRHGGGARGRVGPAGGADLDENTDAQFGGHEILRQNEWAGHRSPGRQGDLVSL